MKVRHLILALGLAVTTMIAFTLVAQTKFQRYVDTPKEGQLNFPFEIVDEVVATSDAYPVSEARIFLDPRYYTKDNLESLFIWYSSQHDRKGELIKVLVYTNKSNLVADKEVEKWQVNKLLKSFGLETSSSGKPDALPHTEKNDALSQRSGPMYDAYFRRRIEGTGESEKTNELYTYCPDLNNPTVTETIVMKGRDPFPGM